MSSLSMKFTCKESDLRASGEAAIYLQAYIQSKQVRINTGLLCKPSKWDPKKEKFRGKDQEIQDLNRILENMRSRANKVELEYRLREITLTPAAFKEELIDGTTRLNFLRFYESQMELRLREKDISENTFKQNRTTLARLKEFRSDIAFSDLNYQFIKDFERFMLNKKGYSDASMKTSMKNVKTFLSIARKKGISFDDPFQFYKVGTIKPRLIYLTKAERSRILEYYSHQYCPPAHKAILAPYLFATFCGGIRYGDWARLKKDWILDGVLTFTPAKTAKFGIKVRVKVIEQAQQFIDQDPQVESLFAWVPAEQHCNRELKVIAKICQVKKQLSTHTARHTFGTLFYQATKDLLACSKLMGHSSIRQTEQYSHIDDEALLDAMEKYDQWES